MGIYSSYKDRVINIEKGVVGLVEWAYIAAISLLEFQGGLGPHEEESLSNG